MLNTTPETEWPSMVAYKRFVDEQQAKLDVIEKRIQALKVNRF
jgi:hypothetical protein